MFPVWVSRRKENSITYKTFKHLVNHGMLVEIDVLSRTHCLNNLRVMDGDAGIVYHEENIDSTILANRIVVKVDQRVIVVSRLLRTLCTFEE